MLTTTAHRTLSVSLHLSATTMCISAKSYVFMRTIIKMVCDIFERLFEFMEFTFRSSPFCGYFLRPNRDLFEFQIPQFVVKSDFYQLPEELTVKMNLRNNKHMFLRDENKEICSALNSFMTNRSDLFILEGPPGVGKTVGAIKWMLDTLATSESSKILIWANLSFGISLFIMQKDPLNNKIKVEEKRSMYVDLTALTQTLLKIKGFRNGGILVLDNCSNYLYSQFRSFTNAISTLNCFHNSNVKMIAVSNLQLKRDKNWRIGSYLVNGWKLHEYQAACQNRLFFHSVKQYLQMDGFTETEINNYLKRFELIAAKYYYAGASVKSMFEIPAQDLVADEDFPYCIRNHVRKVYLCEIYEKITKYFYFDRLEEEYSSITYLFSRVDKKFVFVSPFVRDAYEERNKGAPIVFKK